MNIFVRDIAMARRYAYISDAKAGFLEKIWPGPVTVVFHRKENLPKALTGESDMIGLCMSGDPSLAELLRHADVPIAETSAHISKIVVDFTGNRPVILRTGMVTREELDQLLSGMIE